MIRLTSDKTYKVIRYLLKNGRFAQSRVHNETGVSAGRVNQVVQWLMRTGYVRKAACRYELIAPLAVVKLFPLARSMKEQIIFSREVDVENEDIVKWLTGKGAVFCLTTALQQYDTYFRDPAVNIYADEKAALELERLPAGLTRVNVYKPDMNLESDTTEKDGVKATSMERTVIDLFCDNKAYAAERLVKRLWGG